MEWRLKKFKELTIDELYGILKLREEVFMIEQNSLYNDIDSKDQLSYHLFLVDGEDVVSNLRIIPKGISYNEVSIGRVVTKKEYRKKGLSQEMLKQAIDFIKSELGEDEIRISAQLYLVNFYGSFGFEKVSDVYLEDGIEHVEMYLG